MLDLKQIDLFNSGGGGVATAEMPCPVDAGDYTAITRPVRSSKGLFYFDLETIPDDSRIQQFDLEPLPEVPPVDGPESLMEHEQFISQTEADIRGWLAKHNPPGEWLDACVAAEKAGKARKGVQTAFADHIKRIDEIKGAAAERSKEMATCPEMNRIIAAGWAFGDGKPISLIVGPDVTEKQLLEYFWDNVKAATRVIGFNILGFDLPTIFIRSVLLGVEPTRIFDLKPWGSDCLDLMTLRFPRQVPKGHGLKWICKAMGLQIPAGDIDGSQVERLYRENPAMVGLYVQSDVMLLQGLHAMYRGYFCP